MTTDLSKKMRAIADQDGLPDNVLIFEESLVKLSARKKKIIIKLAQTELDKNHSDKSLKRNLRSIITRMQDSLTDINANDK